MKVIIDPNTEFGKDTALPSRTEVEEIVSDVAEILLAQLRDTESLPSEITVVTLGPIMDISGGRVPVRLGVWPCGPYPLAQQVSHLTPSPAAVPVAAGLG
jgi:hypothetical protein